jgi:signal transduction histidine kinase
MMPSHSPLSEPEASEVTAALIDLAAITQRVASGADAPLGTIAHALLQRVLALVKAKRGAVLLAGDHEHSQGYEGDAQTNSLETHVFRALALCNVQHEEANALLPALPSAGMHIHAPDMTCWITHRLALSRVETGGAGGADRTPRSSAASSLLTEGQQALLVLGWPSDSDDACAPLVARCQALLPLVADSIGAAVASLLLREHMEELERTSVRESLEGMELLKAELLGTVSHELRSPLASIKGYAATLLRHERRLGREERHQFLLAITEASDHMEVIIERLLEVSQLETGQVRIDRAPVDPARLAGEAIAAIAERVETLFPGRFVFGLHLKRADGAPAESVPLIEADQRRLREVLDNLLENAVNYSPGGGRIDVTLRPVVQMRPMGKARASQGDDKDASNVPLARSMLEICIADSGQGIPVDHLERIFERFHRVDTRLTRETNGLGLGLTICKRIVELHDGSIWAENRPDGGGAAFFVRLPLDEPPGRLSKETDVLEVGRW